MQGLSINEMKKIAHDVIDDERKKHNLDINVFPLTFIEYYKSYLKHKNYILSRKVFMSFKPIVSRGFYDRTSSDVVVFLRSINNFQKVERKLFNLLKVCFHEVRHSEQKTFDSYSYNGFCRSIDDFIYLATFGVDYRLEHDNYYFEIDANLCGVRKAKEYLLNHYPDYYEENIEYINNLERKYKYNYIMYDLSYNIDRYLSLRKTVGSIKNSIDVDVVLPKMNSVSPVLEIFMNDDHSFKSVKDIINNKNFKNLDSKIVYSFFSSHSFLNSINFDNLSKEEMEIIRKALDYTHNLYLEQEKYMDEALHFNIISNFQSFKSKNTIIEKIKFIKNYYYLKYKRFINPTRSEMDRIEHVKEVHDNFENYAHDLTESEELDKNNKEKKQVLVDNEEQARQALKDNLSSYELYQNYKNAISQRLEAEKQDSDIDRTVEEDYEGKKQAYEEVSVSNILMEQVQPKTKEEIDADLNDFEEQERIILNSKHFNEEQKKQMIENLYSKFDEYTKQNPELLGRHM